ncbi:hypothetical protein LINGRAHAP2_LOCUS9891 [Linum grandiflorum]
MHSSRQVPPRRQQLWQILRRKLQKQRRLVQDPPIV